MGSQKVINQMFNRQGGNADLAQINHYAVKTRSLCELKLARGRPSKKNLNSFDVAYFDTKNCNDAKDDSIAKYAAQVGLWCPSI